MENVFVFDIVGTAVACPRRYTFWVSSQSHSDRVRNLTGDDRTMIYGAMIWMAEKLNSEDGEHARELWAGKGKEAFEAERMADTDSRPQVQQDRAR